MIKICEFDPKHHYYRCDLQVWTAPQENGCKAGWKSSWMFGTDPEPTEDMNQATWDSLVLSANQNHDSSRRGGMKEVIVTVKKTTRGQFLRHRAASIREQRQAMGETV